MKFPLIAGWISQRYWYEPSGTTTFEKVTSCARSMLVRMLSCGIAKLWDVEVSWIMKWYVPGAMVVITLPAQGSVVQSSMSPIEPSPET